ncbi:phage portal protein [Streptomyces sp.]|uniref:phage portal protein n=1 Tax=Streptomyces sp. TaxID=1931 RepID=UPI002F943D77
MASLLDRIAADRASRAGGDSRFSIDQWVNDYLLPAAGQFGFNGNTYPYGLNQTYTQQRVMEVAASLPGHMAALRASPPAFAAQLVRALIMSQARFVYRNKPWHPAKPRGTFGSKRLSPLETPWPNGTTGELLSRMEWHAGLAGNAYVCRQPNRLRVLRPDWVGVLYGSELEPDDPMGAIDGEIIGYVYQNGGIRGDSKYGMRTLLPSEVAHWSPLPDPLSPGVGMSWVTATVRDIQGDVAATDHKLQFFRNGATPNLVVKGIPAATKEQFNDIVEMMEEGHTGIANAYRTLYLTAGADVEVVGKDLQQIDFKKTQGTGETRIAMVGRVPAPLLGISEGLSGSSLNAGNFGMARRIFADTWVYPMLQDVAASLSVLVDVPDDAELWFDTTDIPLLREDGKDAAEIDSIKAQAIRTLWDGGADTTAAVKTIAPEWESVLKHTGKLSVQLQEPGAQNQLPPGASDDKGDAA